MLLIAGALVLCLSTGVQPAAAQDQPRIVDPKIAAEKEDLTDRDVMNMSEEQMDLAERIAACLEPGFRVDEPTKITVDGVDIWLSKETCRPPEVEGDILEIYNTRMLGVSKTGGNPDRAGKPPVWISASEVRNHGLEVVVCVQNHVRSHAAYSLAFSHSANYRDKETFLVTQWPSGLAGMTRRCSVETIPWEDIEEGADWYNEEFNFGVFLFAVNGGLFQDGNLANHQTFYRVTLSGLRR